MANFSIMRNIIKGLFVLLFINSFIACRDKQSKQISAVIPMAETMPDSALSILNKIDQTKLSDKNLALYSFVYTMAQDKSGLDVDNDSLLRNAYNWYKDKPTDSLYAKCEYYMGKYYSLNDSSEKALNCFTNSIKAAKHQKDYYTQSMALLQSSVIVREYNPGLAISYAKEAINIYNKVKDGPQVNKVYGLLNLAECYSYTENSEYKSINIAKEAINLAMSLKDSLAISDSYQDLSAFYIAIGTGEDALKAAKIGFIYKVKKDVPSILSLARTYCDNDSLQKALRMIGSIPKQDYSKYGSVIYSLQHHIALKNKDYVKVSEYKDSLVTTLESENAANAKAKDKYYSRLIAKEKLRAKALNESKFKTGFIISIIIVSIIVIAFTIYISQYKRKQMQIQNEKQQEHKRLIIEHQKTQITTMRNYLMRKINILRKLESLKSGKTKQVLLSDADWEELEAFLNSSDDEFVERLKRDFSNLTIKDLRFLMLIRIDLPYPIIAQIYHIEPKSVKQKLFLIKEKLGLKNSQKSAKEFIEYY